MTNIKRMLLGAASTGESGWWNVLTSSANPLYKTSGTMDVVAKSDLVVAICHNDIVQEGGTGEALNVFKFDKDTGLLDWDITIEDSGLDLICGFNQGRWSTLLDIDDSGDVVVGFSDNSGNQMHWCTLGAADGLHDFWDMWAGTWSSWAIAGIQFQDDGAHFLCDSGSIYIEFDDDGLMNYDYELTNFYNMFSCARLPGGGGTVVETKPSGSSANYNAGWVTIDNTGTVDASQPDATMYFSYSPYTTNPYVFGNGFEVDNSDNVYTLTWGKGTSGATTWDEMCINKVNPSSITQWKKYVNGMGGTSGVPSYLTLAVAVSPDGTQVYVMACDTTFNSNTGQVDIICLDGSDGSYLWSANFKDNSGADMLDWGNITADDDAVYFWGCDDVDDVLWMIKYPKDGSISGTYGNYVITSTSEAVSTGHVFSTAETATRAGASVSNAAPSGNVTAALTSITENVTTL